MTAVTASGRPATACLLSGRGIPERAATEGGGGAAIYSNSCHGMPLCPRIIPGHCSLTRRWDCRTYPPANTLANR